MSNVDAQKFEKVKSVMGNVFGTGGKIYGAQNPNTNGILPDAVDQNAKLMNDLSGLVKNNDYSAYVKLEQNERGITVHIMDELLFKSGNAELNKSSMDMLDKLADILKTLPNDLRIEGHTDNIPISSSAFPSNWHLSVARALNTAYFLIQNKNLPAGRVSIVGYSEYRPIASNGTVEGRSTNRRVDIVILKK
jgi:chemotaxis protein MotB